jgi:hypothetical protein
MLFIILIMSEIDQRSLTKLFEICQRNSAMLWKINKNQEKLENSLKEQKKQIDEILSRIELNSKIENTKKEKGKKRKNSNFYEVNIHVYYYYFYLNIFLFIYYYLYL